MQVYKVGNAHQRTKGVLITDTRIDPIAKKHGLTNAQVLLAWQAQMGIVYVCFIYACAPTLHDMSRYFATKSTQKQKRMKDKCKPPNLEKTKHT